MSRISIIIAAVVTAALAGAPPVVLGQAQVNQDGHLLDNNLQVGSGGINADQPQPNYAARNDIITGNVTGLGYFHGRIPYRAPGELMIDLPSDDLFRFRAKSWSSSLPTINPGLRSSEVGPVSIYRTFSSTTGGQVGVSGPDSAVLRQPFTGTYASNQAYANIITRQAAIAGEPSGSNPIGTVPLPDGRWNQYTATPLMGLRVNTYGTATPAPSANPAPNDLQMTTITSLPLPGEEVTLDVPLPAPGSPGQAVAPIPMARPAAPQRPVTKTIYLPAASLLLAGELQRPSTMVPTGPSLQAQADQLSQIRTQIFSPLTHSNAVPGANAYLDLLARVQQGTPANETAAPPPSPGTTARAQAPPIRTPTKEEIDAAERAWVEGYRAARGLPPLTTAAPPEDEKARKLREEHERKVAGPLDKLLDQLKKQGPPVKTLAGSYQDRVTELMREAEQSLATGKYMDAEDKYRLAFTEDSTQPLAMVGMVHAQLGAGMIRSAAHNLRDLFEDHPELIATRYEPRLLPPAERLNWIGGQLAIMLRTSKGQDPALMLAYLGYQLNSTDLTRYGLAVAAVRQPGDPLIDLLRRLWLPKPNPATPAQPTSTSPGPDGAKK